MPNPNSFNLRHPRRSACDRCRAYKIRCQRDEGATEPCERCAKARLTCKTTLDHGTQRVVGPSQSQSNNVLPGGRRHDTHGGVVGGGSITEQQQDHDPRGQFHPHLARQSFSSPHGQGAASDNSSRRQSGSNLVHCLDEHDQHTSTAVSGPPGPTPTHGMEAGIGITLDPGALVRISPEFHNV